MNIDLQKIDFVIVLKNTHKNRLYRDMVQNRIIFAL